jgi:hypothetical protein
MGIMEIPNTGNRKTVNMKQPLLLAILVVATYFYFRNSPPTATDGKAISAQAASDTVAAQTTVIVPAPSYQDRWKTGSNAQTNLEPFAPDRWKTGPNAQTAFEPFAPNEQATWNQTPGYTIVAGRSTGQTLKTH